MTKWKCNKIGCYGDCEIDIAAPYAPATCVCFDKKRAEWRFVQKEPEQKQKSETTLPDWCKVGEWVYSIPAQKYDKIIAIQYLRIVTREMKYTDDYINDGNVVQARLRPYNKAEMKALVGKVLDRNGDRGLVIAYDDDTNRVYLLLGAWFSADFIMKNHTIDGKPGGVLEHLENGVWVE